MVQKHGNTQKLTLESVRVRAVSVPLRRPIVAKVGEYSHWPFILIDVRTREGVVGRGYLEPYVSKAVGPIIGVIDNIAQMFEGKPLAPLDVYGGAMKTLHLNGREGMTLIALSGLDMAIWDALARAAGLPLATPEAGSPGGGGRSCFLHRGSTRRRGHTRRRGQVLFLASGQFSPG